MVQTSPNRSEGMISLLIMNLINKMGLCVVGSFSEFIKYFLIWRRKQLLITLDITKPINY